MYIYNVYYAHNIYTFYVMESVLFLKCFSILFTKKHHKFKLLSFKINNLLHFMKHSNYKYFTCDLK